MTALANNDPYDLDRFVQAQNFSYPQALQEIRAGSKRSHWMWYIFPQIAGLGNSAMSQRFAIRSLDEARAYLAHPILGPRLTECAEAVLALKGRSMRDVFGSIDEIKLRSSATLFSLVSPEGSVFHRIIASCYANQSDSQTLKLAQEEEEARTTD